MAMRGVHPKVSSPVRAARSARRGDSRENSTSRPGSKTQPAREERSGSRHHSSGSPHRPDSREAVARKGTFAETARHSLTAEPRDVKEVFKEFDANGDGIIDRKELMHVLQELDPIRWTDRHVTLLLMEVDANFDGRINYKEFVDWVSADGKEQKDFREATGMPQNRAELAALEAKKKAAALRGTEAELDKYKQDVGQKQEALRNVESRIISVRARFNRLKADAERAEEIYIPTYDAYRRASEDVSVPAKSVLDHDIKEASTRSTVPEVGAEGTQATRVIEMVPTGAELVAHAMCIFFKVHPGTKEYLKDEMAGTKEHVDMPDYWTAFMDALLGPKLFERMEKFDKEKVGEKDIEKVSQICSDEQFQPQRVKDQTQKMERTSNFIVAMCLWIHFIVKYRKAGVKQMWDQVHHAETDMEKVEGDLRKKQDELKDAKRRVERLETARAVLEQQPKK